MKSKVYFMLSNCPSYFSNIDTINKKFKEYAFTIDLNDNENNDDIIKNIISTQQYKIYNKIIVDTIFTSQFFENEKLITRQLIPDVFNDLKKYLNFAIEQEKILNN